MQVSAPWKRLRVDECGRLKRRQRAHSQRGPLAGAPPARRACLLHPRMHAAGLPRCADDVPALVLPPMSYPCELAPCAGSICVNDAVMAAYLNTVLPGELQGWMLAAVTGA